MFIQAAQIYFNLGVILIFNFGLFSIFRCGLPPLNNKYLSNSYVLSRHSVPVRYVQRHLDLRVDNTWDLHAYNCIP